MAENTFLVLLCLDLSDPARTFGRSRRSDSLAHFPRMDEAKPYWLIAGILDSAQRKTHVPLIGGELTPQMKKTYNRVIKDVEDLSHLYYADKGFIADPTQFNESRKADVHDRIGAIGEHIYDILKSEHNDALMERLDRILRWRESHRMDHVTIITNDFHIPWYWLKSSYEGPFLCEVCSVGMLQLAAYGARHTEPDPYGQAPAEPVHRALLVNGSQELPCAEDELDRIAERLKTAPRGGGRGLRFEVERATSEADISKIKKRLRGRLVEDFKVVHFTGHYTDQELMINGDGVDEDNLEKIIDGAVLVLDGCSSSRGLKAWTDVEGVTSRLIKAGAVGCVVTGLPVKHDPIISDVLWGKFYEKIRTLTVGQALQEARHELREHLEAQGTKNPAWLLYQLIGNPAIHLFTGEE